MDKDDVREAKFWDADGHHNSSTKRASGAQLVANFNFDFPQVVRQHALGVVGCVIIDFVYNLLLFPTAKIFENRLGFHKVITISWVVHFLGHSVYTITNCNFLHYKLWQLNNSKERN